MRMTDQQDLDIGKLEAQRFDTAADERHIFFKRAVDKNVTCRRRNEIAREFFGADIIKIARYAEGGKWFGPVVLRNRLVAGRRNTSETDDEQQTQYYVPG